MIQKVADPIVSEHFAKAGLGVVLIDQQHGLRTSIIPFCSFCQVCWKSLWISITSIWTYFATFVRSVRRADIIWVFATVREVPCLLSNGQGCRQHPSSHQVLSSYDLQRILRSKSKAVSPLVQSPIWSSLPQSCTGCWSLWHCCSHDQQQAGRPKARRPMQVPGIYAYVICTCTWLICTAPTCTLC